jgi:hypothetical protein
LWRWVDGDLYCNACGLYLQRHKRPRTLN